MDERRRAYLAACSGGLLALLAGRTARGRTSASETATGTAPTDEVRRWRSETAFPVLPTPAVAGGSLYAVESSAEIARPTGEATDHALFALAVGDGSERWRVPLGAPASEAPLVTDDRVYATAGFSTGFTGVDQRAVAVDRESGERAWTFENEDPDQFLRAIDATDGVVLLGRYDDSVAPTEAFVSGVDAETGRERWRYETGDAWSGTADGDSFYVGTPGGAYAFTAADGADRWLYADAALEPAPVAANGRVYLTGESVLAAVGPRDGRLRWRVEVEDGFVTDREITGEVAAVGTSDGRVRAVGARAGRERWSRRLGTSVAAIDRRADGALIVAADAPGAPSAPGADEWAQLVYALDERTGDGDELFRLTGSERLAVAGRTVYVWDAAAGAVSAVDAAGEVGWTVELGAGIRTATAAPEALFLSTDDDAIVALEAPPGGA